MDPVLSLDFLPLATSQTVHLDYADKYMKRSRTSWGLGTSGARDMGWTKQSSGNSQTIIYSWWHHLRQAGGPVLKQNGQNKRLAAPLRDRLLRMRMPRLRVPTVSLGHLIPLGSLVALFLLSGSVWSPAVKQQDSAKSIPPPVSWPRNAENRVPVLWFGFIE